MLTVMLTGDTAGAGGGATASLHTMSDRGLQAVLTPVPHVASVEQLAQGAYPDADHVAPTVHGALHTVSVVVVQAVLTFPAPSHVESAAHTLHGALPDTDHVAPDSHGTSHTVSIVVVQAVLTPLEHMASTAHASHGALPVVDHVEPSAHGTSHTASVVVLHDCLTPAAAQVDSAVHGVHGAFPDPEKDVPPTQGATAPLHTISDPGLQVALTPAPHEPATEHTLHGALPDADHVAPSLHGTVTHATAPFPLE